jgi:hypothetical protein|tara:strand:- start:89 stop:559 length:471 start_codon:yes stop_codon:yes gene_type:complete
MERILRILLLGLSLIFFGSCAKPTVVNISLPGDEKLNCKQLEAELEETQKIKRDAEYAKEGTGGNITRLVLFWPAWARTMHNADVAIQAANDRNFHISKIMKKKNCKDVNNINAQINKSTISTENVAGQLKILKEMYDSGDLTQEEYSKAKKKVLE